MIWNTFNIVYNIPEVSFLCLKNTSVISYEKRENVMEKKNVTR